MLAARENRSKSSSAEGESEPRTSTSPDLEYLEPVAGRGGPRVSFCCERPESDSEDTGIADWCWDNETDVATRESILSSASGRYLAEVAPFLCSASPQPSVDAESHAEQLANFFAAVSPPPPSVNSTEQPTTDKRDGIIESLKQRVSDLEKCAFFELLLATAAPNPSAAAALPGIEMVTVA